jgi:hypothetical protein
MVQILSVCWGQAFAVLTALLWRRTADMAMVFDPNLPRLAKTPKEDPRKEEFARP